MAARKKTATKRSNAGSTTKKMGMAGASPQAGNALPKWPLTGAQTRQFLDSMTALTPYLQAIIASTGRRQTTAKPGTRVTTGTGRRQQTDGGQQRAQAA